MNIGTTTFCVAWFVSAGCGALAGWSAHTLWDNDHREAGKPAPSVTFNGADWLAWGSPDGKAAVLYPTAKAVSTTGRIDINGQGIAGMVGPSVTVTGEWHFAPPPEKDVTEDHSGPVAGYTITNATKDTVYINPGNGSCSNGTTSWTCNPDVGVGVSPEKTP